MTTFSPKRSQKILPNPSSYRGRFAPSPSGPLHFGSLIAALASYLDAKHNNGKWLLRIEDIDPPREQKGASKNILQTLENYGLHWDDKVLYQHKQTAYYQEILAELFHRNISYHCQCTRATIKANGGIYQGYCRARKLPPGNTAIRVINNYGISDFHDAIQGNVSCNKALANEDFIVQRKDGLFAYQLAVVADDIYQNISHVIRGCDLLEPTVRQLSFYHILSQQSPTFAHFPLAITAQGYKLSKQNKAPAIDAKNPISLIINALIFLGQQPIAELKDANLNEVLTWAIEHWSLNKIPKCQAQKLA